MINLRLLRNGPLSAGSSIGLLFGIALYGSTFLLPAMLQTLLGYTAYDAGITLLPRALTIFAMMPVVGWLYNRFDPRLLIAVGLAAHLLLVPRPGPSLGRRRVLEPAADSRGHGSRHAVHVRHPDHRVGEHRAEAST